MKGIALFALLVVGACAIAKAASSNEDAAREAAIQWLQLVDAGRNEEAASHGSSEVRSFEQWLNHFKTQRAAPGQVIKRQFVELKRAAIISEVPEVRRYYILRFKSSFEHKPAVIEIITISKVGCCWEVFEYKVSDG